MAGAAGKPAAGRGTIGTMSGVVTPFLPVAALGLAMTVLPAAEPSAPDVPALILQAQQVQQADAAAWRQFQFSRGVRLERLGSEGRTLGVEETLSEVTPVEDGFDERLLRINGRAPTPSEVESFREKEPFARHYRTLRAGGAEREEEGGYSLATLLKLSSYKYAGREMIGGVECHRLDFSPDA